jgi:DsbC/DsbD-like thiol-disulfide interchange protein
MAHSLAPATAAHVSPGLPLGLALLLIAPSPAPDPQEAPFPQPRVRARLLLDRDRLAPGETTWGLLELTPEDHWHLYWRQPGDAGEPPRMEWKLPPGLIVGELQHPAPSRYREGPLTQFVHEGRLGLPFVLRAAPDFAAPEVGAPGSDAAGDLARDAWTLEASATWLVCKDVCEFEMQSFEVEVGWKAPVDAQEGAPAGTAPGWTWPAPRDASIAAAVAKLPLRLDPEAWHAAATDDGSRWTVHLGPLPENALARLPEGVRDWSAFDQVAFFSDEFDAVPIDAIAGRVDVRAEALSFELPAADPVRDLAPETRVDSPPSGVIVLGGPKGLELALELERPPAAPIAPTAVPVEPPERSR